jgi:hypothetical protein
MAYDYTKKGVWKIKHPLAANDSEFTQLTKQNWNEVVLEEKLKRSDFKEALEVINRVKGPK